MTQTWPAGKEYVTHHELDVWGGEVMRQLDEIRENMLTKEDAENFLTREDTKRFVTKDDLKRFATKEDLKRFATKDDLKGLASKDEIERLFLILDEIRENTQK